MKWYGIMVLILLAGCVASSKVDYTKANKTAEDSLIGEWKVSGISVYDINVSMSQANAKPLPIFSFAKNNRFDFLDDHKNSILKDYFGDSILVKAASYEIVTNNSGTTLVINFLIETDHVITEMRSIDTELNGSISLGEARTFLNGVKKKDKTRDEARARSTKYILNKLL